MKSGKWILPCLMVGFFLGGCQKGPKSISFKGETFVRKMKYRAMAFTILSYIPKGQNQVDATEFINFMRTEVGTVTSAKSKLAMKRMVFMIKRYDKKYKSYKKKTQFCYRQKFRGKKLLVHAFFSPKGGDLRMFQYGKKIGKEQKDDTIDELCENADTVFSELEYVEKRF